MRSSRTKKWLHFKRRKKSFLNHSASQKSKLQQQSQQLIMLLKHSILSIKTLITNKCSRSNNNSRTIHQVFRERSIQLLITVSDLLQEEWWLHKSPHSKIRERSISSNRILTLNPWWTSNKSPRCKHSNSRYSLFNSKRVTQAIQSGVRNPMRKSRTRIMEPYLQVMDSLPVRRFNYHNLKRQQPR